MNIKDYSTFKYKKMLIDNCRSEMDMHLDCIDELCAGPQFFNRADLNHPRVYTRVLPRRIGKSTLLAEQAKRYDSMIVCPNHMMTEHFTKYFKSDNMITDDAILRGQPLHDKILFVDEFSAFSGARLRPFIDHDWKAIVMLGSNYSL